MSCKIPPIPERSMYIDREAIHKLNGNINIRHSIESINALNHFKYKDRINMRNHSKINFGHISSGMNLALIVNYPMYFQICQYYYDVTKINTISKRLPTDDDKTNHKLSHQILAIS